MVVERKITDLTLDDCERRKFDLNADNEVIIRTTAEGEFVFSGLKTAFLVTTQTVTDTAAKIPPTALTARNSFTLLNESETNTIWIGNSDVNDTTKGWPLGPLDFLNFDVTNAIELYAICSSGETANIRILELA